MGPGATSRPTRRLLALALALAPLACALAALVALAATLPAAALARSPRTGNGGGGIGVTGGAGGPVSPTGSSTGTSQADVVKLSGVVNTSGDGITLTVAASGMAHRPLTLSGFAPSSDVGGTVEIEARPKHAKWTRVATGTIGSGGAFSAAWAPASSAQVAIRAVLAPGLGDPLVRSQATSGSSLPGGASSATTPAVFTTSAVMIPIFRSAIATIYGPGLWGHRTACGQRLQKTTLGVASPTLKCGTKVAVDFRGRELTVPVIDRGPFSARASWDLTLATAHALGVKETATVGTLAPAPASLAAAQS